MATSKVRHKKGGTVIKGGTEGVEERHFFMGSGGGRIGTKTMKVKDVEDSEKKNKKKKELALRKKKKELALSKKKTSLKKTSLYTRRTRKTYG